ncbi:aminoglycoside phosphotransferase family protein [Glycomyces sp. A-F 0318]|nr:aminoglycoside phosphotransferase family protein [Glycomyces amatae]MCD0447451.1 aminoglycoside phosphotransferase family protein [Glycomyces amatae]
MSDLVIDEALIRVLLRGQRPDLADRRLRRVRSGWNNQMWRVGEDLAVRLPRTARAAALIEQEHRWLSELAPHLPIPVPVPIHLGSRTDRFPEPWIVTTWVEGEPGDLRPIAEGPRSTDRLVAFLQALHTEAPDDAPFNRGRSAPLAEFADFFARLLQVLPDADAVARARRVWEEALAAAPWTGAPVWIHADLHPSNVVVVDGTLAGVIDFGDMCAGDPATDLAAAWALLPASHAQRCIAAYGRSDEDLIRRARGWALLRGLASIEAGIAAELGKPWGMPTWKQAGEAALDRLLTA